MVLQRFFTQFFGTFLALLGGWLAGIAFSFIWAALDIAIHPQQAPVAAQRQSTCQHCLMVHSRVSDWRRYLFRRFHNAQTLWLVAHTASNQSMKPTTPPRNKLTPSLPLSRPSACPSMSHHFPRAPFSAFATTPCRGLSFSRLMQRA
jgi:hypothetical protein